VGIEIGPPRAIYGILLHSTGDGIPRRVVSSGKTHLEVAREVYAGMGLVGPHYVCDPFGTVEQYAPANVVRYHAGVEAADRRSYLDGNWVNDRNRIAEDVVTWWQRRWPKHKSPSHLYPSKSPNVDYIGIELIPCGVYDSKLGSTSGWTWRWGTRPGFDKQRFSVEQYVSLARLCSDLAVEHGLDLAKSGVLLGHEDVSPYTRPGWDPGDKNGTFSWNLLTALLKCAE
jgi:N-acetyl-anhydromuramyl-L-alanine amidase AmpD